MLTYRLIFVANALVTILLMKFISWSLSPALARGPLWRFLFLTPYPSVRSERYQSPYRNYSPISNLVLYTMLTALIFVAAREFLLPLNFWKTLLLGPAIYFFTESLGALFQLLYSWRSKKIFPIHHRPLGSPSLSQFWGRRWNLWIQDWLKDISRSLGQHSRVTRILITFFISGIFHEVLVNFPYWLVTGESYFGTMMSYFFIQAVALYVDKKMLKQKHPLLRKMFLWSSVVLPSPLFINVPLLTFFGVTNP